MLFLPVHRNVVVSNLPLKDKVHIRRIARVLHDSTSLYQVSNPLSFTRFIYSKWDTNPHPTCLISGSEYLLVYTLSAEKHKGISPPYACCITSHAPAPFGCFLKAESLGKLPKHTRILSFFYFERQSFICSNGSRFGENPLKRNSPSLARDRLGP